MSWLRNGWMDLESIGLNENENGNHMRQIVKMEITETMEENNRYTEAKEI